MSLTMDQLRNKKEGKRLRRMHRILTGNKNQPDWLLHFKRQPIITQVVAKLGWLKRLADWLTGYIGTTPLSVYWFGYSAGH